MKKKPKIDINDPIYEDDFDGLNPNDFSPAEDPRLPSPEQLARSMKHARITIALDDETVAYFKAQAKRHHVKYQQLIRQVLRHYKQGVERAMKQARAKRAA